MNNTTVESYLQHGCGRCEKFQTPDCKVHRWTDELVALRALLQESELEVTMKWGSPCYTIDGKNVLMLSSLIDACAISFFQGAALDDPQGLLEKPGPNSRYARYLKFRSMDDVNGRREATAQLVAEAVAFKRSGKDVPVDDAAEPMPAELEERLESDPSLACAYNALTQGRQRSYRLYVGGAKKSETRARRVERCIPKIFAGKGYNER